MCPISTTPEPSSPQPSQSLSPNTSSHNTQTQSRTPQPRRTPQERQSTYLQHLPLPQRQSWPNQRNMHPNLTRPPLQSTIWNFIQCQMPQPQEENTTQNNKTISVHDDSIDKNIQLDLTPPAQLNQNNTQQSELESDNVQLPLCPEPTNVGWGDIHYFHYPQNHFRVISKNVSMLNPQSIDMMAIATELQSIEASIFLAQETNTVWNPTTLNAIQNQCHQVP